MDADSAICEGCTKTVARAQVTYSSSGQLVCHECAAKTLVATGDDRAAASQRAMRQIAIVGGVLVVGVPSVLVAAGAGRYVAMGLIAIGVLLVLGGRQAGRMAAVGAADASIGRGPLFVVLAGLGLAVLGVVLQTLLSR